MSATSFSFWLKRSSSSFDPVEDLTDAVAWPGSLEDDSDTVGANKDTSATGTVAATMARPMASTPTFDEPPKPHRPPP